MPANPVFRRRTAVWLVLVGGAAFCVMLILLVLGDPAAGNVTTSSVFSRSAVGHVALAELLRTEGREVKVNRSREALGVEDDDLLLILAPNTAEHDIDHLRALIEQALARGRAVLIALPKWSTTPSSGERGRIARAQLISAERAAKPLGAVDVLANDTLARPTDAVEWRTEIDGLQPAIERPQLLVHNQIHRSDRILETAGVQPQPLVQNKLKPLVSTADKVLVGQVPNTRLMVLADPDVLANHGLPLGDNAALTLALIDRLLPADGAVVFDETLHGFAIVPSVWRLLFQPPYLAATLLAIAAMAFTVWRAAARFGAPLDTGAAAAFRGGHGQLIENAGRLLAAGGHGALVAERYAQMTLAEAHRRLHLQQESVAVSALATLNAVGERRGVRARLPASLRAQRPLALARSCQRWAREMFDDA